ncbi:cointegrate resolution protein T [Marichromatium purpuratum 984]|uniref:Cointegrate resolution protein T n=1 Tax=Marichromatium purpuratum 984 TaxID=765910 RepID=W0E3T6_MARPU|nr:DNA-binding protein [Marichromatium purpuratum]AHF03884.1 cointegrate resolution protein T [Marichromatium purpuratum 984]
MARGGITKALVKQARDTLLAQDRHPSIDAVRVALGNTGSKSTIHRYLKELEEEEACRLGDAKGLSEPIQQLIAELARTLETEAEEIVAAAERRHQEQVQTQRQQLEASETVRDELVAEVEGLRQGIAARETTLAEQAARIIELEQQRQGQAIALASLEQEKQGLQERIEVQAQHLASIEEKHRHTREALEHYREASRLQREQDQRRHDQQLQQLQAELRQQAQTLIVKQDEITRLNRDNAALAGELRERERDNQQQAQALAKLREAQQTGERIRDQLEARLGRSEEACAALDAQHRQLTDVHAQLETRLGRSERGRERLQTRLLAEHARRRTLEQQLERLLARTSPDQETEASDQPVSDADSSSRQSTDE